MSREMVVSFTLCGWPSIMENGLCSHCLHSIFLFSFLCLRVIQSRDIKINRLPIILRYCGLRLCFFWFDFESLWPIFIAVLQAKYDGKLYAYIFTIFTFSFLILYYLIIPMISRKFQGFYRLFILFVVWGNRAFRLSECHWTSVECTFFLLFLPRCCR